MIDMRSFSNLWYWIVLAIAWSTASHWILGVPFDHVNRARKKGGQHYQDLETLVRINVARRLHVMDVAGLWLVACVCFALSTLAVLGFWFSIEFAQAVFLIAFPMTVVSLVSLRAAFVIHTDTLTGEALLRRLGQCRLITQMVGVVSIFVTSLWGMFQNIQIGVL
nr:component of SufBCD complex [Tritonibacter litoralis]